MKCFNVIFVFFTFSIYSVLAGPIQDFIEEPIEVENGVEELIEAENNVNVFYSKGINDQIKKGLENMKKQMPCGFPEYGVPPLAPFKYEYKEIEYENLLFSLLGVFTDTKVVGLDNFVIKDVSFSALTLKSKFDINFNKIHTTGGYSMHLFLFNFMKVTGNGKLDVVLRDLRIKGNATIAANSKGLYLKDFNVAVVLGAIESKITGLLGGGFMENVANRAIENFTLFYLKNQQEEINKAVKRNVIPAVNNFLANKSIGDLLEIINKANKPVNCTPPKDLDNLDFDISQNLGEFVTLF